MTDIRRDSEAEEQITKLTGHRKYTCYAIYENDRNVGSANYRLFQNQPSYWYIEELFIEEEHRRKGYGKKLLNYIIDEMWSKNKFRIDIVPSGAIIAKPGFIEFLTKRGFVLKEEEFQKKKIYSLYPKQ